MSVVLYYSNNCPHSKILLNQLSKSQTSNDIHFICIDKREIQADGGIHIILQTGKRILLPPTIKSVPSLLLLHHGNRIITGIQEITHYLKPGEVEINNKATNMNGEPLAFSLSEMGSNLSDNYSYLDMTAEELSAKGNGGLRMRHNYMLIDENPPIATPPDNYEPDKVGNVDLGQLQASRASELKQSH
jgi:hypothetical protein